MRQDVTRIDFQRFFFLAAHQINVELRNAHFAQRLQLFAVLLDRAYQAEAIDDFVRNEISVVAADFAMMQVVVFPAILHV